MDSSMALTSYTSSQLVFCDACEQPQHLQCLGLNTVNAHLHGPAIYSLLYASMLTDVAGVESFDFFCHEELASRQRRNDVGASQRKNLDAAFADPQLTLEDGALP